MYVQYGGLYLEKIWHFSNPNKQGHQPKRKGGVGDNILAQEGVVRFKK